MFDEEAWRWKRRRMHVDMWLETWGAFLLVVAALAGLAVLLLVVLCGP